MELLQIRERNAARINQKAHYALATYCSMVGFLVVGFFCNLSFTSLFSHPVVLAEESTSNPVTSSSESPTGGNEERVIDRLIELSDKSVEIPERYINAVRESEVLKVRLAARVSPLLLTTPAADLAGLQELCRKAFTEESKEYKKISKLFSVASRADFLKSAGEVDALVAAREQTKIPSEQVIFDSRIAELAQNLAVTKAKEKKPELALNYLLNVKQQFFTEDTKKQALSYLVQLSKQLQAGRPVTSVDWSFADTTFDSTVVPLKSDEELYAENLSQIYSVYVVQLSEKGETAKLSRVFSRVITLRPDPNKKNDQLRFDVAYAAKGEVTKNFARQLVAELESAGQLGLVNRFKLLFAGFYGTAPFITAIIFLLSFASLLALVLSKRVSSAGLLSKVSSVLYNEKKTPGYQRGISSEDEYSRTLAILGLDDSASEQDIKTAYREFAKKYHPDRLRDSSEEEKAEAVKKHHEITTAYHRVLEIKKSWFGRK